MSKGVTIGALYQCAWWHIIHGIYAYGGSIWHNLVVCVTENDYSQKLNLHNAMENRAKISAERDYVKPSLEAIYVEVEGGFSLSNDQEPSPWEDM